jgi:hypothetical protein
MIAGLTVTAGSFALFNCATIFVGDGRLVDQKLFWPVPKNEFNR